MIAELKDQQAVTDRLAEGDAWITVVSEDSWPYQLMTTEFGDVVVLRFDNEDDPGARTPLAEMPDSWYPVQVIASESDNPHTRARAELAGQ